MCYVAIYFLTKQVHIGVFFGKFSFLWEVSIFQYFWEVFWDVQCFMGGLNEGLKQKKIGGLDRNLPKNLKKRAIHEWAILVGWLLLR